VLALAKLTDLARPEALEEVATGNTEIAITKSPLR